MSCCFVLFSVLFLSVISVTQKEKTFVTVSLYYTGLLGRSKHVILHMCTDQPDFETSNLFL